MTRFGIILVVLLFNSLVAGISHLNWKHPTFKSCSVYTLNAKYSLLQPLTLNNRVYLKFGILWGKTYLFVDFVL